MSQPGLSHLNAAGQVHMVEVGDRPASDRRAVAEGHITMAPEVLALVLEGRAAKGDVLAVARVGRSRVPSAPGSSSRCAIRSPSPAWRC